VDPRPERNPEYEPLVGALIVTWNRRDDVLECIASLRRSTYPRLDVYVVDNASTDGTCDAIGEAYPEVRLIRSESNLGFAGGNNLGLARMLDDGMDAVFLVNNDVIVAEDALGRMVDVVADPSVGVCAPKVLVHSDPDIIWSAGGDIDPDTGVAIQRFYGAPDDGSADEPADIGYAVGCAMLVRSEVIREVGPMELCYFMYYEEADWCRRIREAGYRIVYVPRSRVRHKVVLGDVDRNSAPYYCSRNRLLYLNRSGTPASRVAWIALSDILRSAATHAVRGRTRESQLMVRAVVDYYAGSFGAIGDGA
jgi:hypothetical protein